MATASATPSEDGIEKSSANSHRYVCPICLESLKTPRSLPCLHTFCEDCLQTFITAATGKNIDGIACPVCRKQIMAPEPELPRDKWAKAFPLNYYLSTYLVQQDASDLKSEIENCKACKRSNNLLTPADLYCKNCGETICDACKQLHKNFQIMSSHVIVTIEHFKNNPSIPEKDEICQHHPGKVVEVYRLDHSKMCCSVCFATKHRHCTDVKSIEECAEDLSEDVLKLISTKLESLLESVEEEMKGKENIGEKRKKCKEEVVVKMTQCVEAAKKNLDILLQQFESDIDKKESSAESQLQNILKIVQGIKTSVIGDRQMLETANKFGSKIQVFVALEKVKMQMDEQLKQISDVANGSLPEGYAVDLKKVEEICKLKSIGTAKSVTSSSPSVTQGTLVVMQSFMKDSDYLKRHRLMNLEPHTIKWVEKWTYKLPCSCYGAIMFGKKIAVVTENKKIVIFNRDGGVICEHTIPYDKEPADINNTGDEYKFFVSFKRGKILKEYRVDKEKITELGQISLQAVAEGFCIFADQIIHATGDCISISTGNGELKNSISAKPQGNIAFLTGCSKQRMIHHTDGSYCLCSRKMDDDTVTRITLSQYRAYPRGLGIDFQGNVYVCCYHSFSPQKLLQISHKDHNIRVALEVDCYTIAFPPDGMSFVLIDYNGNLRFYTLSE